MKKTQLSHSIQSLAPVIYGLPPGNTGSSFDQLLGGSSSQGGGTAAPASQPVSQPASTSDDEGNGNALMKALMTTLSQQKPEGDAPQGGEQQAPDFSNLFADAAAPSTATATTTAPATAPANSGDSTSAPADPPPTFLDQLVDDNFMSAVVNQIVPSTAPLSADLASLFGEGDAAVDSIELSRDSMALLVNNITAAATRQSMNNTVNMLRELVPALSQQTTQIAANNYTQTKQMDIISAELGDNKELIQLAGILSKGKTISDGKGFAKQVKQLMHTINSNQLGTQAPAPVSKQEASKQFIQAL